MSKRRRGYMTVEVDLDDALEEVTDEMLLQEVEDRKLRPENFDPFEDLLEARRELLRNRTAEALAILERVLCPKWSSAKACEIAMRAKQ